MLAKGKRVIRKVKDAEKYHYLQTVLIVILFALIVAIVINFRYLKQTISNNYTSNIKNEYLVQLSIYQEGYASAAANYFGNALNTIENLASSSTTVQDVQTNQAGGLSTLFEHQRVFNQQFNSISVVLASGKLFAVSTDATTVNPNSTLSSFNPVVANAIETHHPAITDAYLSGSSRYVVAFAAPIDDTSGNYIGSIIGSTTVSDLATRINFLSSYTNFSSLITDSAGNVLVNDNQPVEAIENIANSDPIIKFLTNNNGTHQKYEINYKGQAVVAEGTNINFNGAGNIYVLSYMSQSTYNAPLNSLGNFLNNMTTYFRALNIGFLIVAIIILSLWRRRQKQS